MQAQPDSLVAAGVGDYIAQFEKMQGSLPGHGVTWVENQRKQSLSRFSKMGFPTQRDEDWKYTSLRTLTSKSFNQPDRLKAVTDIEQFKIDDQDSYQIVVVDGMLDPLRSELGELEEGVSVKRISTALSENSAMFESLLGSVVESDSHGFTALNNALYNDGIVIVLDENSTPKKSIELLFVGTSDLTISQPRILIVGGANCNAQIIERYVSVGSPRTLSNGVTEVILNEGAALDYYLVQTQSTSAYQVCGIWSRLATNSRFSCRTITLGGALVRNGLRTELDGMGAHCDMFGIYSLTGKQHVDNHTTVIHQAENCSSRESYKGALNQRSRGVFHGRIKVEEGAQKTDAAQSNHTLLLSSDAEIDTKPQLEIYADDVKCSHGATVGRLDQDSIFYLRTRGIDEPTARTMLTYAFVNDVLDEIEITPLRAYLEAILGRQLIN